MSLAYLSPGAILRQAVKDGRDDVVRYLISLGVFKDSAGPRTRPRTMAQVHSASQLKWATC